MSPCLQQKTCKRKKSFFKFFPFTVHVQKSVGGNTLVTYHVTLLHTYKNQSMNKMREVKTNRIFFLNSAEDNSGKFQYTIFNFPYSHKIKKREFKKKISLFYSGLPLFLYLPLFSFFISRLKV